MSNKVYTSSEVAKMLGRARGTIEFHARERGRGYKLPGGRDWLFTEEHVEMIRNCPRPGHPKRPAA